MDGNTSFPKMHKLVTININLKVDQLYKVLQLFPKLIQIDSINFDIKYVSLV